jgi:glycosyltransferase involved in cell wall biosynthesis
MPAREMAGLAQAGVTIAIPNWNHEMLLPRAIDSALRAITLLRADGVPGEVVAIDESSRDGSPMLLRQLEARYWRDGLRVLALADTDSLASSRNQALENARYRYIAFLDADNELIPDNLPVFLRTLEETGAAVVYGNLLVRTAMSRCALNMLSNESVQDRLFEGNYIDAFVVADRLQLLDMRGYETSYRALEDHEMWLHLITNGRRIVFLPMAFGYYYVMPSSMEAQARSCNKLVEMNARHARIFNQVKARANLPLNSRMLRYHPELGYF